ncbi:SOS response-associated peptidase [Chloroflexota bacterium]
MCYNISIITKMDDLEKRFGARFTQPDLYKPLYHVSGFSAPFLPVIPNEDIHAIELFQWGLVPFWTRDKRSANIIRFRTLNARAETVFEKPSFRHSIIKKRCLVLVDGFYEWHEDNNKKYPYYIRLSNHDAFALAGIWENWVNEVNGETRNTFSIITTRANSLMERIHNTRKRMPVILRHEDEQRWLASETDTEQIASLLSPYDDREMDAYTVSPLISRRGENTNIPEVMQNRRYKGLED